RSAARPPRPARSAAGAPARRPAREPAEAARARPTAPRERASSSSPLACAHAVVARTRAFERGNRARGRPMSASTEDDMQPKNDEEADLVELLASMRSLARAMGVEALRRTIRDMPGPVV